MKIWSQYRPGVYVIDPDTLGPEDRLGRRTVIPGLRVEFQTLGGPGAGSLLDTVVEQKAQGWDDETRERVEQYLQGHRDWGFVLALADESMTSVRHAGASCPVMTMIQGGVQRCRRPVETEGDLCDIHQAQRATLEQVGAQPEGAAVPLPPMPPQEATV
jgi:hypothetical protein